MKYYPDRWVLLAIRKGDETIHKIFGTWLGGYVNGDAWRLNSGIKSVRGIDAHPGHYAVEGYSGSVYVVRTRNYGTSAYTNSVLAGFEAKEGVKGIPEKEAMEYLANEAKD